MKRHLQRQNSTLICFNYIFLGTLLFNFQKFWGGSSPPCPSPRYGPDICKLLLVNPATSATGERSFSMARRVKTWLRANMKQQRFNNVALLHTHTHKARTDKIRFLDVANEFVQRNENRFRNFGKFTDLDLSTC